MMPMETRKVLFTATSPFAGTVYLNAKQWAHIQVRHPEVPNPDVVKEAVEYPDAVFPSQDQHGNQSYAHFRLGGVYTYPMMYLVAFVAVTDSPPRMLLTARVDGDMSAGQGGPLYVRPTRP